MIAFLLAERVIVVIIILAMALWVRAAHRDYTLEVLGLLVEPVRPPDVHHHILVKSGDFLPLDAAKDKA